MQRRRVQQIVRLSELRRVLAKIDAMGGKVEIRIADAADETPPQDDDT